MIDQTHQVEQYLNGAKRVNTKGLYGMCFFITKYYKAQEKTFLEIRNLIFDWANSYNYYIDFNLNGCIKKAMVDKTPLTKDAVIKISENDIKTIKTFFDKKQTQKVAVAILAYAKQFADKQGNFSVSLTLIGDWVGIAQSNVSGRYITEMIDLGYLSRDMSETRSVRGGKARTKMSQFRINVPLRNQGQHLIENNDLTPIFRAMDVL